MKRIACALALFAAMAANAADYPTRPIKIIVPVFENGEPTGAMPGGLVRGAR